MSTVLLPPWPMRPLAEERYRRLGAQTVGDGDAGWHLAGLCEAKAAMWDPIDQVAHEDDDGRPGWVVAADPATCHRSCLPWSAQFGGVQIDPEMVGPQVADDVVDALRRRAVRRPALDRGRTEAMVEAALEHMVDPFRVSVRERYDPLQGDAVDEAYHLQIRVRTSDVIPGHDAALIAAVRAAKPGGLMLDVAITSDRDWDDVDAEYADWNAVHAGNTDWNDLRTP